jgi:acyl-CoA synthetase (AMP-forming)/AMP-acid ligase II
MGITSADLNFAAIPLEHSYGFSNLVTPLLLRGVPMAVTEDRFPRAILAAIERTGATVFPGTPVFFQYLADLEGGAPRKLRLCISAAAPLPLAVWQKFRERFGIAIHVFYGSSECGGITYDRVGDFACDGFVGQPMEGVTVKWFDDSGRIEVRSAAVGDGYYPEEDLDVLSPGRFVPGDLVRFQDEGLVVSGRGSDFINVGGRKLNPFEVEQRLAALPGVRQVIVFGVPSTVRGEEPVACVIGEGVVAAEFLKSCAQILPAWQAPRDIWILPVLPLSGRGKISRRLLAERYLEAKKN